MPNLNEVSQQLEEAFKTLEKNQVSNKEFYVIFPFEWYKMQTPKEWVKYAIDKNSKIYFIKKEKRYILNDKGELELI